MNTEEKKKKAEASAVAVATAAGILVNGMFASPADLTKKDETAPPPPPAAVVEYVLPDTGPDGDDDDGTVDTDEEKKEHLSFSARMRRRIMTLPQSVRVVIGVPLWGIGWAITGLLSLIWTGLVSPAAGVILKWAAAALLILLAAVLTLKAVFPDVPIKKFINKRNILIVLIGMAALAAADAVLGIAMPDRRGLSAIVRLVGSLAVMAATVIPSVIKENARVHEESIEKPEEPVAVEKDYRAEVLELVDSIK